MIVGCYSMDLYCDGALDCPKRQANFDGNAPGQFTGAHRTEASSEVTRAGWRLDHRNNLALCPACNRAKITSPDRLFDPEATTLPPPPRSRP